MASIKLKHASGNSTILNSPAANPTNDVTLKLPSTTGSAGQVLKVASANHSSTNAELEFGTATDNNTWVKLSTITASDVSNVLFTNSITGAFDTYDIYVVQFTQLRPASDDVTLRMRIQESGSDFTGTDYKTIVGSGGDTEYGAGDNFRTQIHGIGNNTSGSLIYEDCHGYVYMYNFEANRRFTIQGSTVYKDNASDTRFNVFGGTINRENAVTGVKIFLSSGNINTGIFTLYGIKQ
tara:strand:- start:317 stop:1027 length:711 start_codon:yes stop_codon:yes gene_type:complete